MHQEIRHSLEDYLKGEQFLKRPASEVPAEFYSHLDTCQECASELRLLEEHSRMLRSLRSPSEVEPRAGFYGRVIDRIESQPASIWAILLDPKVGFRLAVASAALVALLGSYLVLSEGSGPEFAVPPAIVSTNSPSTISTSLERENSRREAQQRDAVLVDLASYRQ